MEIPRYATAAHHPSSLDLPEIYVQDSNPPERHRMLNKSLPFSARYSPSSLSNPMSIPNARDSPPPPPLPPPRFVNVDPVAGSGSGGPDLGWHWQNSREEGGWGNASPSADPESSLYGSFSSRGKSITEDRPDYRRGSSTSTIKSISGVDVQRDGYHRIDEGYASLSGTSMGSNLSRYGDSYSGKTGFHSSVEHKFRSNAQAYDKSLLQKLDSRRATDSTTPSQSFPRSPFGSSVNDISPTSKIEKKHQQQQPLSLPIIGPRVSSLENPVARWQEGGFSATSPRLPYSNGASSYGYRSPSERGEPERSPIHEARLSANGSVLSNSEDGSSYTSRSNRGSYDQAQYGDTDTDFPMEETSGLRRLQIDDTMMRLDGHSPPSAAGQKRRASSPLRDDTPSIHSVSSAGDLYRRRESAARASPVPRTHSNHGSVSSTTSAARNNSYTSTLSLAASSITTMSSYGRLSPGGLSPGAISPRTIDSGDSPYTAPLSLNSLSKGLEMGAGQRDSRPSTATQKSIAALNHAKSNSAKLQGGFVCECCPKKPKKFETEEELVAHESEKQYECAYCKNRFKNKNEAERHQNSLHLRRHSWSCAALSGYGAAFHTSASRPAEADTCGYCGDEFIRTGISPNGIDGKVPTDRDWEIRIQHLVDVHKFGECNHAKKFFRADHFRQHLKHSHAGTSGKWTNMLENACMKEEPLPEPLRQQERISPTSQSGMRPDRITEEDEY